MCRQNHPLRLCEKFLNLDFIAKRRTCRSQDICHVCGELHLTILHGPAEETKGKETAEHTRPAQQNTKERESRNRQRSSGERSYHRSPSNKPSPGPTEGSHSLLNDTAACWNIIPTKNKHLLYFIKT
uniref:Uncharacterized protein LOC108038944 n=1 Tax=Drosophila rhopaloa TaxID=1041015 RepID=A0A6P4EDB9_DRORH